MNELTQEQIAQVARVVTGHSEYIENSQTILIRKSWRWDSCLWQPDFMGATWQRSQALALVEFLADHVQYQWKMIQKYHQAIRDKDINTLQAMVPELSEKS